MENIKKEWFIDHDPILGILKIKEIESPHTPIAQVATPQGNWMSIPTWKQRALEKAHLLASAPLMYNTLSKVKEALESKPKDLEKLLKEISSILEEANYKQR